MTNTRSMAGLHGSVTACMSHEVTYVDRTLHLKRCLIVEQLTNRGNLTGLNGRLMTIHNLSYQCIFKYNNYEKIIRSVAIFARLVSNS